MVITWDGHAVEVKRRETDVSCVRLGVGEIRLWLACYDGGKEVRQIRQMEKPHESYTVGELRALLEELERFKDAARVEN